MTHPSHRQLDEAVHAPANLFAYVCGTLYGECQKDPSGNGAECGIILAVPTESRAGIFTDWSDDAQPHAFACDFTREKPAYHKLETRRRLAQVPRITALLIGVLDRVREKMQCGLSMGLLGSCAFQLLADAVLD